MSEKSGRLKIETAVISGRLQHREGGFDKAREELVPKPKTELKRDW